MRIYVNNSNVFICILVGVMIGDDDDDGRGG
jgi:hypothetical protein